MTARTTVHRLQVATELFTFSSNRCCPAPASAAPVLEAALTPSWPTWPPKHRPAGRARPPADRAGHLAQGQPRPDRDMAGYRKFLETIGYLVPQPARRQGHHRQRGRRAGHPGRPAAGGAHPERPLCAERRQRPLGQPVRRAVRHRRHFRSRRLRKRPGLQPKRGAKVIEYARQCWTHAAPLARARTYRRHRLRVKDGQLVVALTNGRPPG
jgi:malate synthase